MNSVFLRGRNNTNQWTVNPRNLSIFWDYKHQNLSSGRLFRDIFGSKQKLFFIPFKFHPHSCEFGFKKTAIKVLVAIPDYNGFADWSRGRCIRLSPIPQTMKVHFTNSYNFSNVRSVVSCWSFWYKERENWWCFRRLTVVRTSWIDNKLV